MEHQDPICQAVNLSDNQRCTVVATTWENIFCRFHGRQCHGLYVGYKRRNAKLDALVENVPPYLQAAKVPLANETFSEVSSEKGLREIHDHLYQEYVLLGKVIDARKLHHKHFYPLQMDYGHQAYLDTLSNRRHIVLRALERLEKRTAQFLYEKEKWYSWVRDVQEEEEETREKESKKVKLEAQMFRRHWNKMQARLKAQREKEEKRRQDAYLEAAYQERVSISEESEDDAEMWDPIEDIVEDERSRYVDLIKHFLWLEVLADEDENNSPPQAPNTSSEPSAAMEKFAISENNQTKKSKKKKATQAAQSACASGKAKSKNTVSRTQQTGQSRIMEMLDDNETLPAELTEPDKNNIETEAEMRKRLKEGVEKDYGDVDGPILVGTIENPHGTHLRTAPLADEEIDSLVRDIREIKLLLFCRLILSHASLLPVAMRSSSVGEFLRDPGIAASDLRDLCLKVEQPSLQDIRDACADLIRGDEPDVEDDDESDVEEEPFEDVYRQEHRYGHLQSPFWYATHVMAQERKLMGIEEKPARQALREMNRNKGRTKVQVCGKSIRNYSSEKSMSRDGWLQFSVMAKDCDLRHAVQLCRNWEEFSQLNFLTHWQYFPASSWVSWGSDRLTQQLHDLGFFPYFKDFDAERTSHHLQVGARSQHRRQHSILQAKNIIVGYIKRNDPVTRRFLQHCAMRTGEILLLVKDGKTGKIITAPEKEHLWTVRMKEGLGRASKNEWEVLLEVGPRYFYMVDMLRKWRLGFDDYYEVWIWDFVPCDSPIPLYNIVASELRRAWRITKPLDMYEHKEHFLRSLTRDKETLRVRSVQPGEQVSSLWDDIRNPENIHFTATVLDLNTLESIRGPDQQSSSYSHFKDDDIAEDLVLFPDELTSPDRNAPFKEVSNAITRMETTSSTVINVMMEEAERLSKGIITRPREAKVDDEDSDADPNNNDYDEEAGRVVTHWSLPRIWEDATALVNRGHISDEKKQLLQNVGLLSESSGIVRGQINTFDDVSIQLKTADKLMIMERDRGAAMIEAFHDADLEPGAQEKYAESCEILDGILKTGQDGGSVDWVWLLVGILEWLGLEGNYQTYNPEPHTAWPHPFIRQDIVRAFAQMAIFFPGLEQCKPVTDFFHSEQGAKHKDTLILHPEERAKTLPDRRTRTGYRSRPKEFWSEWDAILKEARKERKSHTTVYPTKWNMVARPILAKLYLAGVIEPAYIQNSPLLIPGIAIANEEPHRPGKMDLFIEYADREDAAPYPEKIHPNYITPKEWPVFLPLARAFASKHADANPRFAILRIWTAPHFYPAMIGSWNRQGMSFLDGVGRSWIWKFVPKDMPISEWSMYNTLRLRLDLLKDQLAVGERVVHRCETILVMGTDEADLLRYVTAVTFAIQTKPWHREIDLWKSFINVDLKFLESLDPYWLD
ncbi:hypothetical protein M426DRAFT_325209 [Hypoxylon sp. CI-4A]|nr:hypothetical protein M426DRAFT_325209 [Hypoxylon sp. CI-4A]